MSETQIITIITVLTPLYPFLFALAGALFRWLISKLPKDRQTEIEQVIQTVVRAVEQQGAGKTGQEKKQMAVTMVETILKSLHISVSPTLIDALIEAGVYSINQRSTLSLSASSVS